MSNNIGIPPLPLQTIIPSYPYQEYSDDPNVVAFFNAYNTLAQQYLDWYNETPLAVYTNPNISGPLLDWIGQGIYGIKRPVFSSLMRKFRGGLNSFPLNSVAINGNHLFQSGSATSATDDYYKRVLTWWNYVGDGRHFNLMVLRKKVARFLYGVNGTDCTLSQAQTVSITTTGFAAVQGGINSVSLNRMALNGVRRRNPNPSGSFIITVPSGAGAAAQYFQQAFQQGLLAIPFQMNFTVVIA